MGQRTKNPAPSEIVQAIQAWHERHDCVPTEREWARPADDHPSARRVIRQFGSWKGALAAAGYQMEPGHRPGA